MKMRKVATCLLGVILCACAVSCDKTESPTLESTGEISVWSKPSTVTVLRNAEYADAFKDDMAYEIMGGRGEYEASQIIITAPMGIIAEYQIEVCDLICEENKIDKSYIDVYNEKYIEVTASKATFSTGLGWYPDALLPFEKAVEYGENVVGDKEELRNQGIYVETFIPRDIPAGDYTGTFKLTIGENAYDIPASVTVCDFELDYESHLAQHWILSGRGFGDLDSTYSMARKYFNKIAEYRASTHRMGTWWRNEDEWMEVVRIYANPNLRDENGNRLIGEKQTYLAAIHTPTTYSETDGVDRKQFDAFHSRLIYWSIKDGYDYLAKVGTYPGYIDEPQFNNTWDKVKIACKGYIEAREYWADVIARGDYQTINEKAGISEENALTQADMDNLGEFKTQLSKSMSLVGYYVTCHPDDRLDSTLTTQFYSGVSSAIKSSSIYNLENWTDKETSGNRAYVCASAEFGYNLDTEPVSQRLMGWYLYDKGLTGFLLWEVAKYTSSEWSTKYGKHISSPADPYSKADRCASAVGDGFIFYPGKTYGIDGPIGSLRSHQYREASEDYEYFYLLNTLYQNKGYSFKEVFEKICTSLYSEQAVTSDTEIFAKQREAVINLLLLAKKGVFITEYSEINAKIQLKVVSTGEEEIAKVNGETVSATKETTIAFDVSQKEGDLSFETKNGLSFTLYLGGVAKLVQSPNKDVMTVEGGVAVADTLNGVSTVRLDFAEDETVQEDRRVYQLTFAADKKVISRDKSCLTSYFYNPNDGAILVEVWFMGKDGRTVYVDDLVIQSHSYGAIISTRLDCENWSAIRSLEGVRYKVTSLTGAKMYSAHYLGLYVVD